MNNALMFSKASDEWTTPQDFYDALNAEFGFGIDVAATEQNTKCGEFYSYVDEDTNALTVEWHRDNGAHWCNPPYSKCAAFVEKAARSRMLGVTTVVLVPSRTDTAWFHEFVWEQSAHRPKPGVEVRFVRGRLKFGSQKNSAPFPSMVVVFRP